MIFRFFFTECEGGIEEGKYVKQIYKQYQQSSKY